MQSDFIQYWDDFVQQLQSSEMKSLVKIQSCVCVCVRICAFSHYVHSAQFPDMLGSIQKDELTWSHWFLFVL